jgi:hypothetical protein
MKNIYINSSEPNADVEKIQEAFANVFQLEEKANEVWLRGEMPLDTILMYHLRAIDDGNKTANFGSPQWGEGDRGSFEYVKEAITKRNKEEVIQYAKNLAKEFARTMEIITNDIPIADEQNHLIGDCLLLDRARSIIFLLRAFRASDKIDGKLIARWENFVLCYAIIERGGYYYNHKSYRDNFDAIYQSITNFDACNRLLESYYKNEKDFSYHWEHLGENCLEYFNKINWSADTYGWNKTAYVLYKYEILNGASYEEIRKNIFKDDSVSIDHIVARGLSWESLGFAGYENDKLSVEKKQTANELWEKICDVINGIGNLSLSTASTNSSDSNGLPETHITSYEAAGLVKTVEQVKNWKDPEEFADRINNRSEDIIKFISDKIINRSDIWE